MNSRLSFAFVLATVLITTLFSYSQTYSVLYNFGAVAGDGDAPSGTLSRDAAGNFYGTTQAGGKSGGGIIFQLSPTGSATVLYNVNLPPDAMAPAFGVVRDSTGNLYGASSYGGQYGTHGNDGAVFKLNAGGSESVIHSFGKGKDGSFPCGGLIRDGKGNLYGTTGSGGSYGYGIVFKINPKGVKDTLHTFTGSDGAVPCGTLIRDSQGNLYGTTIDGGANGWGTVYEITSTLKYKVLYSFCALPNCADGRQPETGLAQSPSGEFYGTTLGGGANGRGTVFKLSSTGVETILHSFGIAGDGDGYWPQWELVLDTNGNLYGTTFIGGAYGNGTVFKLDLSGNETLLHSFCAQQNCADGGQPTSGLLRDANGNLYGVAIQGAYHAGVVFKLVP